MSKANKKLQTEIQNGLKQVDEVSHITSLSVCSVSSLSKNEKITLIEQWRMVRKANRERIKVKGYSSEIRFSVGKPRSGSKTISEVKS